MRPRKFTYTLAALSANGHANDLTGAGPFTTFTTTGTGDGTEHQTTLASAADLHLITMTVVGTDAQGNTISEAIAGPNANTVNLANYYKTITSITASATLGANVMDVGWTALCNTPAFPTDYGKLTGPAVSVVIGGSCTYTIQQTVTDVFKYPTAINWCDTIAESAITQALSGTTAVRVAVSEHTSGIVTLNIAQARV